MKIVGSAETLNRIVAPAMLLLSLLAGCAGAPEASRSLAFDSTRDTAIVILGTSVNHAQREEVRAGRSLSSFWVEYDPDTLRLVPGGKTFLSKVEGRSEEHTSELQSLMRTSYDVFCLKKNIRLISVLTVLNTFTLIHYNSYIQLSS